MQLKNYARNIARALDNGDYFDMIMNGDDIADIIGEWIDNNYGNGSTAQYLRANIDNLVKLVNDAMKAM